MLKSWLQNVYGCHHYLVRSSSQSGEVVITIWLTVTKYPYLKWQWIFDFWRKLFLCPITAKTLTGLNCIRVTRRCLIRSKNCFTIANIWVHPRFFVESMLLIFLVFCEVLLCGGRRSRDRMIVVFTTLQLPMQSVPITTDVVSSNLDQGEVYNIIICDKVCQCLVTGLWYRLQKPDTLYHCHITFKY